MSDFMPVVVIGCGVVGSAVIQALFSTPFHKDGILKTVAITNSKKMLLNLSPDSWKEDLLSDKAVNLNLDEIYSLLCTAGIAPTIIDCTSSENVSNMYDKWIERGINVVTSNKRAFSGNPERFARLVKAQNHSNSVVLFESTVCAGIPVISTINDIVASGDTILRIEGILSGTLSYIFNNLSSPERRESFSEIVIRANKLGYTEPDPREDLQGTDFARKVVILGRLAGYNTNLEDIEVLNLIPESLRNTNMSVSEFMEALRDHDETYNKILDDAHKNKCSLRYTFTLQPAESCSVKLNKYPLSHQFSNLQGSTNVVSITTKTFSNPLLIMGPGAGGPETAFGIISDIIKILKANGLASASSLSAVNFSQVTSN